MAYTLDDLRAALATTPREREYLEVWADAWSPAERDAARGLLLDAAQAGDHRVPAALRAVTAGDALRDALTALLATAPARVRIEAGWELRTHQRVALEGALTASIEGAELDRHGLMRAIDLLIASGAEAQLVALFDATTHEDVRTLLIERLWNARGFGHFPTVWWSGLGLLRRTLSLALPSFRAASLPRFKKLLGSTPTVEGYVPAVPGTPIPAGLKAAMDDVDKGQGAVPPPLMAPLSDVERQALLVYAADVALNRNKPRGVTYVAHLGGNAYRDLIEWAAGHRIDAYAAVGAEALRGLALAT